MKWGKENKLTRVEFEKRHNIEVGCRVDLVCLGSHLGVDKEGQRKELPICRLKCETHNETSAKFVEVLGREFFEVDDALEDGQASQINRFDAVES